MASLTERHGGKDMAGKTGEKHGGETAERHGGKTAKKTRRENRRERRPHTAGKTRFVHRPPLQNQTTAQNESNNRGISFGQPSKNRSATRAPGAQMIRVDAGSSLVFNDGLGVLFPPFSARGW
eukprot:gene15355-biopygen18695